MASRLTVRSDQAVRKLGNASVRAWPTLALGEVMADITWQQLEGPTVKLDLARIPRRIVFQAPDVARDTLLTFRATVRTTGGATDSDDVLVVVENAPQAAAGRVLRPDPRLAGLPLSVRPADTPIGSPGCVFDPQLGSDQRLPAVDASR